MYGMTAMSMQTLLECIAKKALAPTEQTGQRSSSHIRALTGVVVQAWDGCACGVQPLHCQILSFLKSFSMADTLSRGPADQKIA